MTQVIMLMLLPIGLYFYFFVEKKHNETYQKTFDDFQLTIEQKDMPDFAKIKAFEAMLLKNNYKITKKTEVSVEGEKKIMSMSLFAASLGVLYIGLLIYLVYYFYYQKAHAVEFKIEGQKSL